MKESYTKGIATHSDPELCVCLRKVSGEALTGAHTGVLRKQGLRSADAVIGKWIDSKVRSTH